MTFAAIPFLVGREMARRSNLQDSDANIAGLMMSMQGISALGVVTTKVIIDQKADQQQVITNAPAAVALAQVPAVMGQDPAGAKLALERVGLQLGAVITAGAPCSTAGAPGTIVAAAYPAGSFVPLGTPVDVQLQPAAAAATGVAFAAVPKVSGDDQATATKKLEAAGLKVAKVTSASGLSGAALSSATVVSTNPVEGLLMTPGSVVELNVK